MNIEQLPRTGEWLPRAAGADRKILPFGRLAPVGRVKAPKVAAAAGAALFVWP